MAGLGDLAHGRPVLPYYENNPQPGEARQTRCLACSHEGCGMAVYRLFKDKAFEPETITMMTHAYTEVCRTLALQDRDDLEASAVAQKVIEFTQRGERDPIRLREHVLQALRR
jgi:hypothetical protein